MRREKTITWVVFLICMFILQLALIAGKVTGSLGWIWFWILMPVWLTVIMIIVDYLFTKIEQNSIEFWENLRVVDHLFTKRKIKRVYELTGVKPRIIFEGNNTTLNLRDFEEKLAKKDPHYDNIEHKYKGKSGYNITNYIEEVYGKEANQLLNDLI